MTRKMKDSGVEWIGMIPDGWSIKKLRYVVDSFEKGSGITKEEVFIDGDTPCVRYGEIYTKYNHIFKECISRTKKDKLAVLSYFSNGDILFVGTGELVEEIGKNVVYLGEEKCLAGGDIIVAKHHENPVFLDYALNSQYVQAQKSSGKTKLKVVHISAQELKNLIVLLPPPKEQQQIADFLDAKCASIDDVIAKTNESVEEYKKLKRAVITEAVTRGVRGERNLKDSGIDWVKKLPVEWNQINPKALFSLRKDRATETDRQLTSSQQYGVIYQDEYMQMTGNKVVVVEKDFDILKHVEAGDFVISMRSFQGGLEYSTNTGSISSAYVMLIPNLQLVEPRYYRWLLKSPVYINALQSTSNLVRDGQAMRYSNFAQVRLFKVPLDEQREIADYLDSKCAAIDTLISKKQQFIDELTAYKKSLIYEYVTGKKEVPA